MSFEQVSQALNTLVKGVGEVYRGYQQYIMVETVFTGLLTGEVTLLIGSHGLFKTSMAVFIGKLFSKPAVKLRESFTRVEQVESWLQDLAKTLEVDWELLERNLVEGIHVEYDERGGRLNVNVEVDASKHPKAERLGESERVPLEVFSIQVNDQLDPEEIVGYAVDHPAILGRKPPHMVKRGRIAGADYVVLDECFKAPKFLSKLFHILNEKVAETPIGVCRVKPLGWVLASNPLNEFYQTNVRLTDTALLDRFAFSARALAPSVQEILLMAERWRRTKVKPVPVELIYEARRLLDEVEIPREFKVYYTMLVSHLSRCYFTPAEAERTGEAKDPFEAEKDCSLCIYGRQGSSWRTPCSIANVGKVRALLRIEQAIKAHSLLNMRRTATDEDLEFAMLCSLPHRLAWNDNEFLARHGNPYTATRALLDQFTSYLKARTPAVMEVEQAFKHHRTEKKLSPEALLKLKAKYSDDLPIRALVDEGLDMLKEAAKKKGDIKTLQTLTRPPKLKETIETLRKAYTQ